MTIDWYHNHTIIKEIQNRIIIGNLFKLLLLKGLRVCLYTLEGIYNNKNNYM